MEKVLLVDDEPNILRGYQRQLRKQFDIHTAQGGEEALETIREHGPFAVVVSDMRMPNMDGVQFLSRVSKVTPDTVRIMLTGNADQQTATDAVNEGQIFRFLNKPCPHERLAATLESGLSQYRLVTAERELLSKTLGGSVRLLTEVLTLVNPAAFGRAAQIKRLACRLSQIMQLDNQWEIELAAMLSLVGCIAVPKEILDKVAKNASLSPRERTAFLAHPKIGHDLIAKIPRLEQVANIIAYQEKHFDGSGVPSEPVSGEQIPIGSRILKVSTDFNALVTQGKSHDEAFEAIQCRSGWYDPQVVAALTTAVEIKVVKKLLQINELTDGMVLDEHVMTESGEVLIARGQEVTQSMCERLKSFAGSSQGVREPIRVSCPINFAAPTSPELAGVAR